MTCVWVSRTGVVAVECSTAPVTGPPATAPSAAPPAGAPPAAVGRAQLASSRPAASPERTSMAPSVRPGRRCTAPVTGHNTCIGIRVRRSSRQKRWSSDDRPGERTKRVARVRESGRASARSSSIPVREYCKDMARVRHNIVRIGSERETHLTPILMRQFRPEQAKRVARVRGRARGRTSVEILTNPSGTRTPVSRELRRSKPLMDALNKSSPPPRASSFVHSLVVSRL